MRNFLLASTLLLVLPNAAFAGPLCQVPADSTGPASPTAAPIALPEADVAVPTQPASAPRPLTIAPPQIPPEMTAADIAQSPALRRIQASGAKLFNLGALHGLRVVYALAGNAFRFFYISPDGEVAISGIAQDGAGRNLTLETARTIPGAVPTVLLGDQTPAPQAVVQSSARAQPDSMVATMEATAAGVVGSDTAPRLWVFVDPQCPVSRAVMTRLLPLATAGKVQLAVAPAAVLDEENGGRSSMAAARMIGADRSEMVADWLGNRLTGDPGPDESGVVETNTAAFWKLAGDLPRPGVPFFVWRDRDGHENRSAGVPLNLDAVLASAGR